MMMGRAAKCEFLEIGEDIADLKKMGWLPMGGRQPPLFIKDYKDRLASPLLD